MRNYWQPAAAPRVHFEISLLNSADQRARVEWWHDLSRCQAESDGLRTADGAGVMYGLGAGDAETQKCACLHVHDGRGYAAFTCGARFLLVYATATPRRPTTSHFCTVHEISVNVRDFMDPRNQLSRFMIFTCISNS